MDLKELGGVIPAWGHHGRDGVKELGETQVRRDLHVYTMWAPLESAYMTYSRQRVYFEPLDGTGEKAMSLSQRLFRLHSVWRCSLQYAPRLLTYSRVLLVPALPSTRMLQWCQTTLLSITVRYTFSMC